MKPKFSIGRIDFYSGRKRSKTDHMGRFGGGWQYKLGITAGDWRKGHGVTVLVALWSDEYRVFINAKDKK
ncbi:hypothetical protein SEA_GREENHEARTS_43 [Arthrobacter phage GreenHearts]|uniref:Uncharacterized protein n=1 Tax=Arthrobacter phage GreenHearts TaxID=2499003 RepID=A0A3S9UCK5_9CAUD|nr:hypothetical protein KDI97_gp43 [Arthrobacter phage GreenHearts]AZS08022.1 hypothetical protein SEA_GREENHEARTS_43 [Arthrobacter phage GreenHearts]